LPLGGCLSREIQGLGGGALRHTPAFAAGGNVGWGWEGDHAMRKHSCTRSHLGPILVALGGRGCGNRWRRSVRYLLAVAILLSGTPALATGVTVLDFEQIVPIPGAEFNRIENPALYTEDGYQIESLAFAPDTPGLFSVSPGQDPTRRPVPSTVLGLDGPGQLAELTNLSGAAFDLSSNRSYREPIG